MSTDDKEKLPPPPTVSAEAIKEARAAASSTWAIPKDKNESAPVVFQPPRADEPEKAASADEPETKTDAAEPGTKADAESDKKAAPVVGAKPSDEESVGVPTPITRATEVFDALLADVSAPIPVGVQTRKQAASAEAAGTRQRIVATAPKETPSASLPKETSSTSQPRAVAEAEAHAPDRQRWLFGAGGLVLGIAIGIALGRSPDTPERPRVASGAPARPSEAQPKPDAASAKEKVEPASEIPLPPPATYPDEPDVEPSPDPAQAPPPTAEPEKSPEPNAEPERSPEPTPEPESKQPAAAADPRALGGVTEKGTFIDDLIVGDADKRGSCASPRNTFSIEKDERIYACFHITRPRAGDRLTVRWRKDGDTKRRSFFPMAKTVEATRTRAFMKVREGHEGTWSVHVTGPNETELASATFTIVP